MSQLNRVGSKPLKVIALLGTLMSLGLALGTFMSIRAASPRYIYVQQGWQLAVTSKKNIRQPALSLQTTLLICLVITLSTR